jgi:hypothetical protein
LTGALLPGQSKDFVFGEYVPTKAVQVGGVYGFLTQVQIFAATTERPMIWSSTFSGTWQVVKK